MITSKNTPQKYAFGALLLLAIGLNACQPQPAENPQPGLLTGGAAKTWIITDATQNGLSHPRKSCIVGDIYVFKADNSVTIDEGAAKCQTTDPQITNGRWALNNSTITIAETGGRTLVVLAIKSIDGTKMVTELNDNDPAVTVEYAFTAQ